MVVAEQKLGGHRLGKLGSGAEAAILVIKIGGQAGVSLVENLGG